MRVSGAGYCPNTTRIPPEYIQVQPNTTRIQPEYNLDTTRIQPEYNPNTTRIQPEYDPNTTCPATQPASPATQPSHPAQLRPAQPGPATQPSPAPPSHPAQPSSGNVSCPHTAQPSSGNVSPPLVLEVCVRMKCTDTELDVVMYLAALMEQSAEYCTQPSIMKWFLTYTHIRMR